MTDKYKKPRKIVHAELNRKRHEDIQKLADLDVEDRSTKFNHEKNRYEKIIENRKLLKKMREEEKKQKLHIGKRKHIEKRAIAEVEDY
ncbi:hypothetical protein [Candidatus Harpocratesius sp.]